MDREAPDSAGARQLPWQRVIENVPSSVVGRALIEAGAAIEPAGGAVPGRDMKPDAAAAVHAPKPLNNVLQGDPAIAAPLARLGQGEPAEPPARCVAPVGMNHEEADQAARVLHAEQQVRQTALHRAQDGLDGIEEVEGLVTPQVEGQHRVGPCTVDAVESEGSRSPGSGHDTLWVWDGRAWPCVQ